MKTKCIGLSQAGRAADSLNVLLYDHSNDVVNMNRCSITGGIVRMRKQRALQVSGFPIYIVILLLVLC